MKQSDGERAEITEVHLLSEDDDIALLKVADGIEAKQFDLPNTLPKQGGIIDLIGFAIGRDFASVATLEVKSFIEKYPQLSLIHISEPTRRTERSRMPSSA